MKKASIVSIGDELLAGQVVDSNCAYLCEKLMSASIPIVSEYTVGDDTEAIVRSLRFASENADIVLTSGGLGPTKDDVTREAFGRFLGSDLELREELLEKIAAFFSARGYSIPKRNKVQAYMPCGTVALENKLGTACGIKAAHQSTMLFALPGVPAEMKQMFNESVLPELSEIAKNQSIAIKKLRCFGAGEPSIAELVGEMMARGRNPQVNCTVQQGIITLTIVATAPEAKTAEQMAEADKTKLTDLLGDLIYGHGDQSLAKIVGCKLTEKKQTLAVAESCTGGLLAKMITDVPGSSSYFLCGWVTYHDRAKVDELGVRPRIIERNGAISEAVAVAMAGGARDKAGANYAVAITGIAGPAGQTDKKPVGLVYIALASENGCQVRRAVFSGDREAVRIRAANTALNMLRLSL